MKHAPSIYIGGVRMECEFTPTGNAVVLDDIRVQWGRDSLYAPTNPSECHLTVLDPVGEWGSNPALFGAELRIETDLGVMFRGKVDGISMTPTTIGGEPDSTAASEDGWPAPPPDVDVWQVDITAADVLAGLASTVAPGYEGITGDSAQFAIADWGPGYWNRNDTQSRLQQIENRAKSLGFDIEIEAVNFGNIAPPGVAYYKWFREPFRRAGDDLYTLIQSVQMRSNEPIHTNYIPGTKVVAEGGFPAAAGLILTYVSNVIDVAADPAAGLGYAIDCGSVYIASDGAVQQTVEQSIGSLRLNQYDYSTEIKNLPNGTISIIKYGNAQLNFTVQSGAPAQYEIGAVQIANENLPWQGDGGVPTQSQRASDWAAQLAPIIASVNGKLVPPPIVFDIENQNYGAAEPLLMNTYTPDDGAFTFPGARYEDLIGWGPFFQMIGGELRFRQGWESTVQFAPSPASGSGNLAINALVTIAPPTFDQYALRVTLATLGTVSKGL